MPAGDYEKAQTLGEGTYGVVFRARRSDGVAVAVKRLKPHTRVRVSNEGLNLTALREIKYLRELRHENIIEVRECG
jgi:cyclin-dependent kinase 7